MADLYTKIRASITSRLEVARAATPGPWVAGRTTELNWGMNPPGRIGDQIVDSDGVWPQTVTVEGTHVASKGEMQRQVATMASRGYTHSRFAADAAHIAANDPSTTIARCVALLRILDGLPPQHWIIRELAIGEGIEVTTGG